MLSETVRAELVAESARLEEQEKALTVEIDALEAKRQKVSEAWTAIQGVLGFCEEPVAEAPADTEPQFHDEDANGSGPANTEHHPGVVWTETEVAIKPKTKKCSSCEAELPLTSFSRRSKSRGGLNTRCRDCIKQYMADYKARKAQVQQRGGRPGGPR